MPFQHAVRYLSFGFTTKDQSENTLKYLTQLHQVMARTDRGVLRAEMCATLAVVLKELLDSEDPEMREAWHSFETNSVEAERFWRLYKSIYTLVKNWSRKSKHMVFCYDLMKTMKCIGGKDFYFSTVGEDFIPLLSEAVIGERHRDSCLQILSHYLRDLPKMYVDMDPERFTTAITSLIELILPKKGSPPRAGEAPVIVSILAEVSRKHIHFVAGQIELWLDHKSSSIDTRIVLLQVLSKMAREQEAEIAAHNYLLGPKVGIIIDEQQSNAVVRAAIECFPIIHCVTPDKQHRMRERIAMHTLSKDNLMSQIAITSLSDHLHRNPGANLVPILGNYVNILAIDELVISDVGVTFDNIRHIISAFLKYCPQGEAADQDGSGSERSGSTLASNVSGSHHARTYRSSSGAVLSHRNLHLMQMSPEGDPMNAIDWNMFRRVREHMFGICLMWCAHTEEALRQKAIDVMNAVNTREFRESEIRQLGDISNELSIPQHLIEDVEDVKDGVVRSLFWTSRLTDVLSKRHETYHRAIAWAWSRLSNRWNVFCDDEKPSVGEPGSQEWATCFLIWRNNLRFLCLSLRIPWTVTKTPVKDLKGNPTPPEPPCPVKTEAIDQFFEDCFNLIRCDVPDVDQATLNALEELSPCTFERLLVRLKIYENKKLVERIGARKAEKQFKTSLFLMEPVLDLLSRIYGQLAEPTDESRKRSMIHTLSELVRRMLLD